MSRSDLLSMLDELSTIVGDANRCLDDVIDRRQLPNVDDVGDHVREIKRRLDELNDRVRLMSGGRVAYRTDELPEWLIDKIGDDANL